MKRSKFIAAILAGLAFGANAQEIAGPQELETMPLVVETEAGAVELTVEIADEFEERRIGMMFRTEVGDHEGMLFLSELPEHQSIWMENTLIPLDIIFIRSNGKIANIVANAEPLTRESRKSKGRALAVLEVGGGRAEALGIKRGDLVRHPAFRNWPEPSE